MAAYPFTYSGYLPIAALGLIVVFCYIRFRVILLGFTHGLINVKILNLGPLGVFVYVVAPILSMVRLLSYLTLRNPPCISIELKMLALG